METTMRLETQTRGLRAASVVLGFFVASSARAGSVADSLDNGWRFSVTYLWVPRIDGTSLHGAGRHENGFSQSTNHDYSSIWL
jgi:hypothetical protein